MDANYRESEPANKAVVTEHTGKTIRGNGDSLGDLRASSETSVFQN